MFDKFLFFYLFVCYVFCQNYSIEQVRVDLEKHRLPVYFCFDEKTMESFGESKLDRAKSYIEENLGYNFLFHLEGGKRNWEDLSRKNYGVKYAVVCTFEISFFARGSLSLYYQDDIKDMQWENVFVVTSKSKNESSWIMDICKVFVAKIKEKIPPFENSFDEINKLKKEMLFLKGENKRLKNENKRLKNENKKLSEKHSDLKVKRSKANAVGKKLEFVGIHKMNNVELFSREIRMDVVPSRMRVYLYGYEVLDENRVIVLFKLHCRRSEKFSITNGYVTSVYKDEDGLDHKEDFSCVSKKTYDLKDRDVFKVEFNGYVEFFNEISSVQVFLDFKGDVGVLSLDELSIPLKSYKG